jgi:hypothetical protein
VASVKARVAVASGIPVSEQRLLYATKPLEDHRTLSEYDVCPGGTLRCSLRLLGGADPLAIQCPEDLGDTLTDLEVSIDRLWVMVCTAMIFLMQAGFS